MVVCHVSILNADAESSPNSAYYADGIYSQQLSNVEMESVRFAKEFLESYYISVDQHKMLDTEKYISTSNFLNYVNRKVEASSFELQVYDKDDKENYVVELDCVDIKNTPNAVYLKIDVDISFNYKGVDFNSGYGEQNWIKIITDNEGSYKISDWYVPYNEYDLSVRGDIQDIETDDVWETEQSDGIL